MGLPSIAELIERGFGRSMTVGAFSTGIVGGGNGTILDLDQPEFVVGVPAGTFIMPIYVEIVVQGGISTADSDETEALLAADVLGYYAVEPTPTGAAVTNTPELPVNMRTGLGRGSACKCASGFVVDMTTRNIVGTDADPVLDMELARVVETADQAGTAANVAYRNIKLIYAPLHPPIITGPATLCGYWGGTIATVGGFAVVQWVEGPISMLEAV